MSTLVIIIVIACVARGLLEMVPRFDRWLVFPPYRFSWHRKRRLYVMWLDASPLGVRRVRYVGFRSYFHDGPIPCFGFWWFHFALDYHNPDWPKIETWASIDKDALTYQELDELFNDEDQTP